MVVSGGITVTDRFYMKLMAASRSADLWPSIEVLADRYHTHQCFSSKPVQLLYQGRVSWQHDFYHVSPSKQLVASTIWSKVVPKSVSASIQ